MFRSLRNRTVRIIAPILMTLCAASAAAQDYPSRPITFIVAFAPGVTGTRLIQGFDASAFEVRIAAEVLDFDPTKFMDAKMARRMTRFIHLGMAGRMQIVDPATGIARSRGLSSLIPIDRNATRAREGFTMDMDRDISRRHMLALSATAGGLAFDGGISRAFAQASTRIEQLAPELDKIIATSERSRSWPPVLAVHSGLPRGRCGGRRAASCCSPTFTTAAG